MTKPFPRETLQRLAHRRTPDAQCLRERSLGEHLAGLDLQRADHLLERDVRAVGEAAVGVFALLDTGSLLNVVQVRLQ